MKKMLEFLLTHPTFDVKCVHDVFYALEVLGGVANSMPFREMIAGVQPS